MNINKSHISLFTTHKKYTRTYPQAKKQATNLNLPESRIAFTANIKPIKITGSFVNSEVEQFIKKLKDGKLSEISMKEIQRVLSFIMKATNKIGEGFECRVYTIGQSDIVARVPKERAYIEPIEVNKDIRPHMLFKAGKVQFNQRIYGQEAGLKNSGSYVELHGSFNKSYVCEAALKMSQEGFDDFARFLKKLNRIGLKTDTENPNNFILDTKNKKIYVLDNLLTIKNPNFYRENTINDLIKPLLLKITPSNLAEISTDTKVTKTRRQILKKCILAAHRAELQEEMDQTFIYSAFRIADIKTPYSQIKKELQKLKSDNKDPEQYLNRVLCLYS